MIVFLALAFWVADVFSPESIAARDAATQHSFQPKAPYYATFFYLWHKNPNTDGSWSYWTDHGNQPPNTWFSYYLPDPNPSAFEPSAELYSSNNYEIFKWQAAKMAEARQEVAIASWFGPDTKQDVALDNILNDFTGRSDNPYPNLRWALYYEDEGFSDPSVATLVSDLTHIKTHFTTSPYFLKIDGKPVIFVYGGGLDTSARWKQAQRQMDNQFYICLKVYSGYRSDPQQPDSWHQYAPAARNGSHEPYSFFISPGFWLDNGDPERLVRDAADFEKAVKEMVAANSAWKLVQTWNEWGEGTGVEPAQKVRYNALSGREEPDTAAAVDYAFHNLYVDILNRHLPPLEQGSGAESPPDITPPAAPRIRSIEIAD